MSMVMKPKDIHIAVRRCDGIDYLMEKFGIANKEELFEAIRKTMPLGAEDQIRKLGKNWKRKVRRESANSGAETISESMAQTEKTPVQELSDVDVDMNNNSEADISKPDKQDSSMCATLSLDQLQVQEAEISAIVKTLEVEHKKLVSHRRELVQKLEQSQKALKELLRILRLQEKNVTELYEEYNQCAAKMQNINEDLRAYNEWLDDTRKHIGFLQKITVLVYRDGRIEVDNAEIPTISDETIMDEVVNLIGMPDAGEITINELKTIAKLQKMVKIYEGNGKSVELAFDSAKVQKFWEAVNTVK